MLTSLHRRQLLQLALLSAAASFLPSCRDNIDPIETIRGHFLQDISRLPSLNGGVTPFSVYAGVALVVNIWASWCPPCIQEMPSLEKLNALFDPKDLRVIGISGDSDLNLVREFLMRVPLTFPMLWDRGNNILHIPSFPSTFLLRRDHSIADIIVGERNWADPKMIEKTEQLLQVQQLSTLTNHNSQ